MRKRASLMAFFIFMGVIAFFAIFGKSIRDYHSPKVEIVEAMQIYIPSFYIGIPDECYFFENGEVYAFIIEEDDKTGENAYYAKKIKIKIGNSENGFTELIKGDYTAKYISNSDRNLNDGDRIVIVNNKRGL